MKINSINTIYNTCTNNAAVQRTFKGLWGKDYNQCVSDGNNGTTIYYDRNYYPFIDEDSGTIQNNMRECKTYEIIDHEQNVNLIRTPVLGTILPILSADYDIFLKKPKSLNPTQKQFIERIIKNIAK